MYINPSWRILTVGDGDLSFSHALLTHYYPSRLTATIYDGLAQMRTKYGEQYFQALRKRECRVLTGFDVTTPATWAGLDANTFDVVIFQFPLIPGFTCEQAYKAKGKASSNLLNRRLLRQFLLNAFTHFLDPRGAQLCFITSKDVKPYRDWNIENSLNRSTDIRYLGSIPFEIDKFPGYLIRNVDRDKHVKDTQGITYIWTKAASTELDAIVTAPAFQGENECSMCRAGPFTSMRDREIHQKSRRHRMMQRFEQEWADDLNQPDGSVSEGSID